MKIEIKNRWSGELIFSAETDSWKVAVEMAIKAKANLSEADLSEANLSEANLSKADLSWADLSWANLSWANLSEANLSWANLSEANLSKANLSEADLRYIKHDVWGVLLHAIPEVLAFRQAIIDGKIDGSVYEGECACLCGTIANIKKCDVGDVEAMNGIEKNSNSMAERFFMGIKKGDMPENNGASKEVLKWVDEFIILVGIK